MRPRDKNAPRPRSPLSDTAEEASLPSSRSSPSAAPPMKTRYHANVVLPDHECTATWRTNCHYCVQRKLICDLHWEIVRVSTKPLPADDECIQKTMNRLWELSVRLERILDMLDLPAYSIGLEKISASLPLPPTDEEGL
ncbi:hypothetical protein GLOTRDRAFT_130161 [Gloeophyllum trabeum ATCC 11539]|uniref:Uncharacterized protein n=1 Tax=Gloeophyllum trabeum (strain ATCC 11539 / FP-39264 / Madison 617) TaxID=670483 RepID=S7RPL0_GLOTA|nr:uncharacterized protein GLOTRDRAFT_130161 [Gloeophyllum trabeum ATCC 11539]EPQ54809.1 hypothetical protein GLOTRDRAFT_130161 [Gloeophyllum trabeum ATCC 11539]